MKSKKTIRDVDVRGKRAFVRVDFNVPMDAEHGISDDSRIRGSLPTIQYLLNEGACIILASHLGRPKGRVIESLRLQPVADRLSALLQMKVVMARDCIGLEVRSAVNRLSGGEVLLLENLRFHSEEEANDRTFSRELASLADVYVNDAFGAAHRAHASTVGITAYLPSVSGLLMESELEALRSVLDAPIRPLAALIGGAKISSKIGVLQHLLTVTDEYLIGGGMANTLLLASGVDVGSSLVEREKLDVARAFSNAAREAGKPVHLPEDVVIAERVEPGAESRVVSVKEIPAGWSIVDIGPGAIEQYASVLQRAGTVLWNGPMGVFEISPFDNGTRQIAKVLASAKARTVVGGGDSVAAVEGAGLTDRMYHVSTGGGASLEFLEGRELPGVAALADAM
ncbi:MAG: phosphoglycerate kinase [Chloroflexota bacterium]